MGRLVVEARGTAAEGTVVQGVAAAGNSEPMPLVVSVGGGQRGDYALGIVPVTYQGTQYTWAFGRYIFFLSVTRGADQGQTVCSVFVH